LSGEEYDIYILVYRLDYGRVWEILKDNKWYLVNDVDAANNLLKLDNDVNILQVKNKEQELLSFFGEFN
jgi:hypothetical protein